MKYTSIKLVVLVCIAGALQAMNQRKSPDCKPVPRELYEMLNLEFEAVHKRFDVLEKKIEDVTQKIEKTEESVQELKNKLDFIKGSSDIWDVSEGDQTEPEIVAVLARDLNFDAFKELSDQEEELNKRK